MTQRPNRINIDLGPYKAPWLAHCAAAGETPSSAFRQVVAKLLAAKSPAPVRQAARPGKTKIRKQILLTATEAAYVLAAAQAMGMRDTQWIVALIRAHTDKQPQLGMTDIAQLGKSNLALLAIGRNLNQIARVLNAGAPPPDLLPVMTALQAQLSKHVEVVAALLSNNLARWRPA